MQALQVVSLTLLAVLAVSAQSIGSGKCPQPPVQKDFDPTRVNVCSKIFMNYLIIYLASNICVLSNEMILLHKLLCLWLVHGQMA